MQKAGFPRPVRGVPFDQVSISSSVPAFFALAGLVLAPAKPGFHWTACAARFFTDPSIPRIAPTLGISRWSFGCVSRSIPSNIVRGTCRNFTPTWRTPISSAKSGLTPVEEMALGFVQLRHLVRKLLARGVADRLLRAANSAPGQLRHGFLRGDRQDPCHAPPLREDDARRIRRAEIRARCRSRSPAIPPVFR